MSDPRLLVTSTREPFQPVRITYSIPNRAHAAKRLRGLECVDEDRRSGNLTVFLAEEASGLGFVPPGPSLVALGQSVIIGQITFPKARRMALQVRSVPRAIGLAKIFRPVLGPRVQAVRARIVNRWFGAEEAVGELDVLDGTLDRDVTVIDPEKTAEALEAALDAATSVEERQRIAAAFQAGREGRDVPAVEDFPLHPEEETDEMRDLELVLNFRWTRAGRRWKGEDVTLAQVIREAVAAAQTDAGDLASR